MLIGNTHFIRLTSNSLIEHKTSQDENSVSKKPKLERKVSGEGRSATNAEIKVIRIGCFNVDHTFILLGPACFYTTPYSLM